MSKYMANPNSYQCGERRAIIEVHDGFKIRTYGVYNLSCYLWDSKKNSWTNVTAEMPQQYFKSAEELGKAIAHKFFLKGLKGARFVKQVPLMFPEWAS